MIADRCRSRLPSVSRQGPRFPVQQGVRRRLLPAAARRSWSRHADPWVEDRVTDVNEEIDDDVDDRDEQRDALDHDVVASVDRVEDGLADPREVEDRLRQDGARQERAEDRPMTVTTGSRAVLRPWRTTTARSARPFARAVRM